MMENRIVYYFDDDFRLDVSYDKINNKLFLHIDVFNWKLSVYKKILSKLGQLKAKTKQPLYSVVEDDKAKKANEMCGLRESEFSYIHPDGRTLTMMEL